MRPTVLIVDDHESFRRSVRRLLEAEGFVVLGEAADGKTALSAVLEMRPELVLLDIMLPDMDGFTVAERLMARPEPPLVILTSSRRGSEYGPRLEKTSACGFISKAELSGASLVRLAGWGS